MKLPPATRRVHDLIVIGASAGGVEALPRLIGGLPADLPAAVFVVLHLPPDGPDLLAGIIGRASALPVHNAIDGEKIHPGRIYLAPPDRHLLVDRSCVRLSRGPRENCHRPAIDALFRSAAEAFGPRVVGVILTGHLDDGTAGLNRVKAFGGVAIVQEPADAAAPEMPQSALRHVRVDHRLPLAGIGPLLVKLAGAPAGRPGKMPAEAAEEKADEPRGEPARKAPAARCEGDAEVVRRLRQARC